MTVSPPAPTSPAPSSVPPPQKKSVFASLQEIGKALMLPVAVLPVPTAVAP